MRAMMLCGPRQALREVDVPTPRPGPGEVLIRIRACAVCRTDLHIVDGELPHPKLPLIPGHEIIGVVAEAGKDAGRFRVGARVGVPWLGWACGSCAYCATDRENLCDQARFTGYTRDGGYAEYTVADQRFCFPIPDRYSDAEAAPLLCAGLIGYRSLAKTGDARRLGIYGFSAGETTELKARRATTATAISLAKPDNQELRGPVAPMPGRANSRAASRERGTAGRLKMRKCLRNSRNSEAWAAVAFKRAMAGQSSSASALTRPWAPGLSRAWARSGARPNTPRSLSSKASTVRG